MTLCLVVGQEFEYPLEVVLYSSGQPLSFIKRVFRFFVIIFDRIRMNSLIGLECGMNLTGILLGIFMLALIGFGFFWVIKLEYAVGARIEKWVGLLGLMIVLMGLLVQSFALSAVLGIFGGSILWGAMELPEQARRAERGLFPVNERRQSQLELQRHTKRGQKGGMR